MGRAMIVGAVLFDGFEMLDLYGPLEMLGMYPEHFEIRTVAMREGAYLANSGPQTVAREGFDAGISYDILVVPGGPGVRSVIDDADFLAALRGAATAASHVTSICTGSAVLARAGVLDGLKATSNKRAFDWVASHGPNVDWQGRARWVEDGKFMTASGVSAGMDMSLALIGRILGRQAARDAAMWAEYTWNEDANNDPFAKDAT